MSRKLIFLDIDGTLTTPGSNIPPGSALLVIRKAQNAGNKVLLCTGRNPAMLSPLLRYGFDGYVACSGGFVSCDGQTLFDCPMTDSQKDTAMHLFAENGVFRTVEAKDGSYCDEGIADFLGSLGSGGNSELMRWRKALEEELGILPMSQYDGRPVYKIVFLCRELEQLLPAREALEQDFNFVVQESFGQTCYNGELVNRRFHKGTGVTLAAKALGIPLEDTVGFGDSMNDLEMIETVGTSVCMANGSEALKKVSDVVCPSVEEDGLARAFADLGLF